MKLLLLLLLTSLAYAQDDQIVTDVGLGIVGTKGSTLSQDKFARVGLQEDVWYDLKQRFNVGGWDDTRGGNYSSAAFAGYQLGFEVTNDVLQGSIWSGPSVISATDAMLGGPMQFNETLFFGIVDKQQSSIGVAYNHFSSAGIYTPNLGRDYLGLQLKFPW